MQTNNSSIAFQNCSTKTAQKIHSQRSHLIQQSQVCFSSQNRLNLKNVICARLFNSVFLKEMLRLIIYSFLVIILLNFLPINQPTAIYSIHSNSSGQKIYELNKEIPGLFPHLSSDWQQIINVWDVALLRGKQGSQGLRDVGYQLEFKHSQKKQDVVYITKEGCNGHIIMEWELYGNNIYLTEYQQPKSDMTIPNLPKDQKCIQQNSQLLRLLKYSSIWTITEKQSRKSLFLLIEEQKENNQKNNYILIANQHQKS